MENVFFWFRRDLRIEDNHGLYKALTSGYKVRPVFIFDIDILSKLANKNDARLVFIHAQLIDIRSRLESKGGSLEVYYGKPLTIWKKLLNEPDVKGLYTNED